MIFLLGAALVFICVLTAMWQISAKIKQLKSGDKRREKVIQDNITSGEIL